MSKKYVQNPIDELPKKQHEIENIPPPFDTKTRFEGAKNATIEAREKVKEFLEGKKKMEGKQGRSLFTVEKACRELIEGETVVNMTNEMIENLRRVFVESKLRGEEELDAVEVEEFFYNICDDKYLERRLNVVVRETTDEDRETID